MGQPADALLIRGRDADAARLTEILRAVSPDARVHRFMQSSEATLPASVRVVVVALEPGTEPPQFWKRWISERRANVPLVVLIDSDSEPELEAWMNGGADGWLVRPHFPGLGAILAQHARHLADQQARAATEQRWRDASSALLQLARHPTFRGSALETAFHEVVEAAVRELQVSRCGVWLFEPQHQHVDRAAAFERGTGLHLPPERFELTPALRHYFDTLGTQRLFSVSDVQHDPRTLPLVPTSFGPRGVGATIDVAVRLRGELVGAVCLEHVGGPRTWNPGEVAFATGLADLVSLALESNERSRAETALRDSETRFRELFEHSNDSIVLYRVLPNGRVECEDINPAAELMSGLRRSETLGRTASEVLQGPVVAALESRWGQAIRLRAPILYEQELVLPAGRRWVNTSIVPYLDESGRVVRLAAISRDVTQMREAESLQRGLEAQMAEAQKNEALARLASHIAHDVNGLLTVIVAHAQRLAGVTGKPSEVAQAILQATGRGRELTQQVLTFGRRRPPERKPIELTPLVRETLKLLEPTAGAVRLRELVAPRLPRVLADSGQIHQVLTNLCTNALQAMPGGQGTLTIALESVDVDFAFASRHPPLQAGRWVRLTVTDTGVGMDEATLKRIFEPFFSTRLDGSGTGLGLAVVQSIVQGHDGAVVVESRPSQGTSFQVYLPPLQEELTRPGSGQHLMLVDDHPGMARVSARLLETLGYRTTVFDDPREALKAFRSSPSGFDAVLTDLSMPQMSGEEFTRELRELRPEVPVIVSSGMASELDDAARERLRISAVLVKPWRLEEAVTVLQRLLG